ncbi:formyltransferase family protein [Pleionea sediminis]|uniref:formyltransferase family protein n=1 Tax=Pleionea sediminis TaxID=2569479 RepID=UPI00197CB32A|nr:formyltransferase family protein [Pleionea sediminis]
MEAIYEVDGKLDLAITLEDGQARNKSGRIYLDEFCSTNNIPLVKSSHINNEVCIDIIKEYDLDWLFIIGWSQIASNELLSAPKKGVLGIHPTLLPEGRGRAAIPWAILKGLDKTGVTLFKLNEGVDTGDIVAQVEIPLDGSTDAAKLYDQVNIAHVRLIKEVFHKLRNENIVLKPQVHELATEWPGRKPEDGEINLEGSVFEAERLIRAVTHPYPGAYYFNDQGQKVIIWKASVDEGKNNMSLKFYDGTLIVEEYDLVSM